MRRIVAALVVAGLLIALAAPRAHASHGKVALGLAAFAVFNQLVAPALVPRAAYATVYAPPPVVVVQPAWPTVIQYPHGRYELRANGATYSWVWIPEPPPPPAVTPPSGGPPAQAPAPCTPTGRYVKTPQGTLPECE
mgnify:CR=1 FL=1